VLLTDNHRTGLTLMMDFVVLSKPTYRNSNSLTLEQKRHSDDIKLDITLVLLSLIWGLYHKTYYGRNLRLL
jgi:hypothetical protein